MDSDEIKRDALRRYTNDDHRRLIIAAAGVVVSVVVNGAVFIAVVIGGWVDRRTATQRHGRDGKQRRCYDPE
jgi:hypothetical protein